jgi:tRNA(Ile)-lysidine synthase
LEKIASADPFLARLVAGLDEWSKSRRALVAVSGGRDSVALLHGLHTIGWRKLTVIHLDHQLRGHHAKNDARFVTRLATKLNFPLVLGEADTRRYAEERGLSLEHAARELRHVFFESVARRTRCRLVVLGHHADDQVETCLFNFLRGAGATGLAGMRPVAQFGRLTFLRPMLSIRRGEIDAFLQDRKIKWREDASNLSPEHTRNRLRHRILPLLAEEFGPSFPEAILRTANILATEDDWMRSEAAGFPASDDLPVKQLAEKPLALRRRIVRQWLKDYGIAEAGFAETTRVLSLLDIENGPARINLPDGIHARRREGRIFLERP